MHDGLDRTRCPKLPELCRTDADPDLKFPLGFFSLTSEAEGSSFPSEAVPDINLLICPCSHHVLPTPLFILFQFMWVLTQGQSSPGAPRPHGLGCPRPRALLVPKKWLQSSVQVSACRFFINFTPDKAHLMVQALRNHG